MAKLATDVFIDGGLDEMGTSVNITICAGQPTNYADIATRALATTTIAGGDFTKADGSPDGRQSTVTQQSTINIDTSGDADHVVIDDGVSEYLVTTCTPQTLTDTGTVTIPAWIITIRDPT